MTSFSLMPSEPRRRAPRRYYPIVVVVVVVGVAGRRGMVGGRRTVRRIGRSRGWPHNPAGFSASETAPSSSSTSSSSSVPDAIDSAAGCISTVQGRRYRLAAPYAKHRQSRPRTRRRMNLTPLIFSVSFFFCFVFSDYANREVTRSSVERNCGAYFENRFCTLL